MAFVCGDTPLWDHFAVADVFADPFLDPVQRRSEVTVPPFHCLAGSVQLLGEVLARLLRERTLEADGTAMRGVVLIQRALSEAMQIGAQLPIGKIKDDDKGVKLAQAYLEFLNVFVMKVNGLREGELLLVPGGWRTSEDDGHALMFVLMRHPESFSFAVVNTGEGITYHFARSECSPPKLKRSLSLVIDEIPIRRLTDSSFWYMLFRPMVYPSKHNGPAFLYETLLPYLNSRPLASNATSSGNVVMEPASSLHIQSTSVAAAETSNPFGAAASFGATRTAEMEVAAISNSRSALSKESRSESLGQDEAFNPFATPSSGPPVPDEMSKARGDASWVQVDPYQQSKSATGPPGEAKHSGWASKSSMPPMTVQKDVPQQPKPSARAQAQARLAQVKLGDKAKEGVGQRNDPFAALQPQPAASSVQTPILAASKLSTSLPIGDDMLGFSPKAATTKKSKTERSQNAAQSIDLFGSSNHGALDKVLGSAAAGNKQAGSSAGQQTTTLLPNPPLSVSTSVTTDSKRRDSDDPTLDILGGGSSTSAAPSLSLGSGLDVLTGLGSGSGSIASSTGSVLTPMQGISSNAPAQKVSGDNGSGFDFMSASSATSGRQKSEVSFGGMQRSNQNPSMVQTQSLGQTFSGGMQQRASMMQQQQQQQQQQHLLLQQQQQQQRLRMLQQQQQQQQQQQRQMPIMMPHNMQQAPGIHGTNRGMSGNIGVNMGANMMRPNAAVPRPGVNMGVNMMQQGGLNAPPGGMNIMQMQQMQMQMQQQQMQQMQIRRQQQLQQMQMQQKQKRREGPRGLTGAQGDEGPSCANVGFSDAGEDKTSAFRVRRGPRGPPGSSAPGDDFHSSCEDDPATCDFRTVPRGGDCSYVRCIMETLRCGLRCMGLSSLAAKHVSLLLRWSLVKMIQADMLVVAKQDFSPAAKLMVETASKQLAHAAAKQARATARSDSCVDATGRMEGASTAQLFEIKRTINAVRESVEKLCPQRSNSARSAAAAIVSSSTVPTAPGFAGEYPFFGRFRRDGYGVERLAGGAAKIPIFRPVELSLVPDRVTSFSEVTSALRHCDELCTKMAYQTSLIKNTYCLRVALIQHLFTRVLPLPLPLRHPKRQEQCFWGASDRTMRRETQIDLLRLLRNVAQHFSVAALSLRVTRDLDASRILTMASLSAICDVLMRKAACDAPSQLSLHYSGEALGPVAPFGIEMRQFAAESSLFLLPDPALALVRTQVLDYFEDQRDGLVDDSHILFRWERSMLCGVAEETLIDQLCLQVGYPRPADARAAIAEIEAAGERISSSHREDASTLAAKYLTGERREIIHDFPELGHFRDVVFLLKVLMSPTADAMPDVRAWMPIDANLVWFTEYSKPQTSRKKSEKVESAKSEIRDGVARAAEDVSKALGWAHSPCTKFVVRGFGEKHLKPEWPDDGSEEAWYSGLMRRIKGIFFRHEPRVQPSMGDPSFILGTEITCEEDVLHVKSENLPDFGGRILPRHCELLMQYLTAPYLRIPLVLRFFSDQERTLALSSEELMELVDCVVFEPGMWQRPDATSAGKRFSAMVPVAIAEDSDSKAEVLNTPLGMLFNELHHAPEHVTSCVERMLLNVLEVDSGRFSVHTSPAALYVLRLLIRVYGYILTIIDHTRWSREKRSDAATGAVSASFTGAVGATLARGLACRSSEAEHLLLQTAQRWRLLLLSRVVPMLVSWLRRSDAKEQSNVVCMLRAHLAYVFKEVRWDGVDDNETEHVKSHETSLAFVTPLEGGNSSNSPEQDFATKPGVGQLTTIAGLAARTLLCSQVYITASYRVSIEPRVQIDSFAHAWLGGEASGATSASGGLSRKQQLSHHDLQLQQTRLGIGEMELFGLFQRHRVGLLSWLSANKSATNELMEFSIQVLVDHTEHDTSEDGKSSSSQTTATANSSSAGDTTSNSMLMVRKWESMEIDGCRGRFVPDTEATTLKTLQAQQLDSGYRGFESFEAWMQEAAHHTVDTEINVQLGEFTLKKHRVEPLDEGTTEHPDFAAAFGENLGGASGLHSAEVKNTAFRTHVRMVGRRHDLLTWNADILRQPKTNFTRLFPAQLNSSERWILDVLDPLNKACNSTLAAAISQEHEPAPDKRVSNATSRVLGDAKALLMGLSRTIQRRIAGMESVDLYLPPNTVASDAGWARLDAKVTLQLPLRGEEGKKKPKTRKIQVVKELVVFRSPPAVHVYDIREHGRRFFRSLAYASDQARALMAPPTPTDVDESPSLSRLRSFAMLDHEEHGPIAAAVAALTTPLPPLSSLEIRRNLSTNIGEQVFVPTRHLFGLLPAVLLEQYIFWQRRTANPGEEEGSGDGHEVIIGYLRPDAKMGSRFGPSQLLIEVNPKGKADTSGQGGAEATATVRRLTLIPKIAEEKKEGTTTSSSEDTTLIGIGATDIVDPEAPTLQLVDMLCSVTAVERHDALAALRHTLLALDNLSHVLVWSRQPSPRVLEEEKKRAHRDISIDYVELPRLGLTFEACDVSAINPTTGAADSRRRLSCLDHVGLFISESASKDKLTQNLLEGIPHGVVLERAADAALFLLLPAGARPICRRHTGTGGLDAAELLLDRNDEAWLANIAASRGGVASDTGEGGGGGSWHYLYPIHPSRSFLFTPTLSSALYLLLIRWIMRQYEEVFRLADLCVTDVALSAEESQIIRDVVEAATPDSAADAAACRLKLMLVTAGTPIARYLAAWNVTAQLIKYLGAVAHVSAPCRLTRQEELLLLELQHGSNDDDDDGGGEANDSSAAAWIKNAARSAIGLNSVSVSDARAKHDKEMAENCNLLLINRMNFLHKLQAQLKSNPAQPFIVQVLTPEYPRFYSFDAIVDRSCVTWDEQFLKKLTALSYSRPKEETISGQAALLRLIKWADVKGTDTRMRMTGGKDSLGFLFLYELMTEQLPFKVLPGDSPYNWGALLLRLLPQRDTEPHNIMSSMLRVLSFNRQIAPAVPKYEDTRKFKISLVFRGQNIMQRLLSAFK